MNRAGARAGLEQNIFNQRIIVFLRPVEQGKLAIGMTKKAERRNDPVNCVLDFFNRRVSGLTQGRAEVDQDFQRFQQIRGVARHAAAIFEYLTVDFTIQKIECLFQCGFAALQRYPRDKSPRRAFSKSTPANVPGMVRAK